MGNSTGNAEIFQNRLKRSNYYGADPDVDPQVVLVKLAINDSQKNHEGNKGKITV